MSEKRAIEPLRQPPQATVRPPGSKSITNRALLLTALADGESEIEGALFSDDSIYMASALRSLGVGVEEDRTAARFRVRGDGGVWPAKEASLFIGNAGTAARFLVAAACLGHGTYVIDGNERMRQRPIDDLVAALRSLRVEVECPSGCPPVTIHASGLPGGVVEVASGRSSQFLSALLMVAPYAQSPLEVRATADLIAHPYVDLTVAMMNQFGVAVAAPHDYRSFHPPLGRYQRRCYAVEADASSAHYFLAAAALTGGQIRVEGIGYDSLQGDTGFARRVLKEMGAEVTEDAHAITVSHRGVLGGGDFDMNAMSDTSMTLAVLAPFASEPVRIRNVAHIRGQESDRLTAVTTELRKLGARVEQLADGWRISPAAPGELHGAEIETYDDHRIAMAFALAGLRIPGVVLRDPGCVAKTYPDFFADLERLR